MNIQRLAEFKRGIIRLKSVYKSPHYRTIANSLTYHGISDALGPFIVYHMTGTSTIMVDAKLLDCLLTYINSLLAIPIEHPTKHRYQSLPEDSVTVIRIDSVDDLQQLRHYQASTTQRVFDIKKDKERTAKTRASNRFSGALRHLNRTKQYTVDKTLMCIDIEAHERNQSRILEIGLCIYNPNVELRNIHIIVQDNMWYRNGVYVADNRDHFLFGESIVLTMANSIALVTELISQADYLVGHSFKHDQEYLLPHIPTIQEVPYIDTSALAYCILPYSETKGSQIGLKRLMEFCGLTPTHLHNGGNDAHFTMQTLLAMCTMSPSLQEFN